jgi:hypothetical protein
MKCSVCDDCGWVCEAHPDRPFKGEHACNCGGAGESRSWCNDDDTRTASAEGLQNRTRQEGLASLKGRHMNTDPKGAFDLWWEWAEKPADSPLTIPADIREAVMALTPQEKRDRAKVNEAVRDGLKLGPLRPAGSEDLHGVPKATE